MTYPVVRGTFRVETVRNVGMTRVRYLVCKSCRGRTEVHSRLDADGNEIPTIVLHCRTPIVDPGATVRNNASRLDTNIQNGVS
jgi:hypothetical protein